MRARGPVMAVAGIIETRAYFRKRGMDRSKSPRPRKRQQVQTLQPTDDGLWTTSAEELGDPPLDLPPVPAHTQDPGPLPRNPAISSVAREALSAPWTGLVDSHRGDDDVEDSNDINGQTTEPIQTPGSAEPGSSDVDSGTDDEEVGLTDLGVRLSGSSTEVFPDIFETDADLNTTEYSKHSCWNDHWTHQCLLTLLLHVASNDLSVDDLDLLRLFSLRIDDPSVTDRLLAKITRLSKFDLDTLHQMKKRLEDLSELVAESYDCCVRSCVAFTGPHAKLKACPHCRRPRYCQNGKPMKTYRYIPLIPRLIASFLNRELSERMGYRSDKAEGNSDQMTDVFDGSHYLELLQKEVTINDHGLGHTYFSDHRDIALGLATDGVNPWRRRKSTFWPILLFNFNLPPEERFHDNNAICIGEVPGPEKPKDMDSFLYPLVQELLKLSVGVRAYDAVDKEIFTLRAYLITVFGDIPAVSMLLWMKGHNGRSPCRLCMIQGIRIPNSRITTHYIPHCCKNLQAGHTDYDPANLPQRSHKQFMAQASEVQSTKINAQSDRLATEYGVNGIPLLSVLDSLSLPLSTGYEFMHLVFENLIPNLALLWSGNFKGLDTNQPFVFSKAVWEAIGATAAASQSTIPSSYGAAVPNIATDRSTFSAETWSLWALFVAPVVLNGQFSDKRYYNHFCDLVRLINLCLKFEISRAGISQIRHGFIRWVKKYEEWAISIQFTLEHPTD